MDMHLICYLFILMPTTIVAQVCNTSSCVPQTSEWPFVDNINDTAGGDPFCPEEFQIDVVNATSVTFEYELENGTKILDTQTPTQISTLETVKSVVKKEYKVICIYIVITWEEGSVGEYTNLKASGCLEFFFNFCPIKIEICPADCPKLLTVTNTKPAPFIVIEANVGADRKIIITKPNNETFVVLHLEVTALTANIAKVWIRNCVVGVGWIHPKQIIQVVGEVTTWTIDPVPWKLDMVEITLEPFAGKPIGLFSWFMRVCCKN